MSKYDADLNGATWRKSSYSGGSCDNCVEVADLADGVVAVRDSTDPTGPALRFTADEWSAFLDGVRGGEFNA